MYLQYIGITVAIVVLVVAFLLFSHSIIANQRLIKFLSVIFLLIIFEFINLLIHPFIEEITHHSPALILSIMVCIAALLVPLHHKIEALITPALIEKNNRIRLAAAKKTIAALEGNKIKQSSRKVRRQK